MAITTAVIGINTGNVGVWTGGDLINQLQFGLNYLGWQGEALSGLAVGISTVSGGGKSTTGINTYYQNVKPISSTGSGTGSSFYIYRGSNGHVDQIYVNRPGYGYTGGEIVTLSAEDIGGSASGATNLTAKLIVDGTVSGAVSYAVSFSVQSGSSVPYVADGTDRIGVVTGITTSITVREGDTLKLYNNSIYASSYPINICWNPNPGHLTLRSVGAATTVRVMNVINQGNTTNGGITTVTFLPGQAGTYHVLSNSANSSANCPIIIVQPANSGTISTVSYGSTSEFLQKVNGDRSHAVWRQVIQSGKYYGDTYRSFILPSGSTDKIYFHAGSGYFPANVSQDINYNGAHQRPRRFAGAQLLDLSTNFITSINSQPENSSIDTYSQTYGFSNSTPSMQIRTGNQTSYQLDLNIYRSGVDPRFAVFSYKSPTLSSTHLGGTTHTTWFFHNFTTDIWDLDHVFLGGLTQIIPSDSVVDYFIPYATGNVSTPVLNFVTITSGMFEYYNTTYNTSMVYNPAKRSAEWGYSAISDLSNTNNLVAEAALRTSYMSNLNSSISYSHAQSARIYNRGTDIKRTTGGSIVSYYGQSGNEFISSNADYNAVIKGIPLSSQMLPVPYYIPDDFVLIQFDYLTSNANIQQGDTITISGSEVYTVITGSYQNSGVNRTRGILFCGRKV